MIVPLAKKIIMMMSAASETILATAAILGTAAILAIAAIVVIAVAESTTLKKRLKELWLNN